MPKQKIDDMSPDFKKQKIKTLSLTVTSNCNLTCKYCYEKSNLRNNKVMDPKIAKDAISEFMASAGYDWFEIHFFGGEPLLAFPFIKEIVDWFHFQTFNKKHRFLIGTNGTILNNDIKEWLIINRHCVNIGLSLDGTKAAHDISRSKSYDQVKKNLPFFQKYWPHQPAKMTLCADTIPFCAESIIELEELGLNFTANLGFEDQWDSEENKLKLLEKYEDQLSVLVDFYSENTQLFPVNPLLTSVPEYLGIPSFKEYQNEEITRFCGAGHEIVSVDVDGKRYPCHRFMPWVTNKPAPKADSNCQKAWKPDKCSHCKLIPSCPTCAGYNWEINNDTGIRTTFHCEFYKLEVMASCLIEWKRLQQQSKNMKNLTFESKKKLSLRIEALWEIIENGI